MDFLFATSMGLLSYHFGWSSLIFAILALIPIIGVTLGDSGAPSQITQNLDALFSTSLANYRKTLTDNIGTSNALFFLLTKGKFYESVDGGSDLREPLQYGLPNADWYDGYDQLRTDPFDGITQAVSEWRQLSVPVAISRKEERQNAQRILPLLKSKIQQAEISIKETFAKAFLQGNGSGAIETAASSLFTGASGIDPLPLLVKKDPTTSTTIQNINQSTYTWWRNQTKSSSATTYDGLLKEISNIYNSCAKGTGGPPDFMWTDQETYELLEFALYQRYRNVKSASIQEFPFENIIYKNAKITWDEFMPDVQNGTLTPTAAASGKGNIYFINSKFMRCKYDSETNFINTPFQKPVNQDAKVSHILWMGQFMLNNRRKHGVLYNIARSLT